MSDVRRPSRTGKKHVHERLTEASPAPRHTIPAATLNPGDPQDVRTWARMMRDTIEDLAAAGIDATQPFSERFFSRAEARRRVEENRAVALSGVAVIEETFTV